MRKLLIVVDFQNDFVTGALGFPGASAIEDAVCRKIRRYRQEGEDVVFTLDSHEGDYLSTQEGRRLPVPHCQRGSEGHKLTPAVAALCTSLDRIFEKPVFGSLTLANHLHGMPYSHIELCGVVSYICVISNAVLARAAVPEAEIVVDAGCVAGPDESLHQKALDLLEGLQVSVLNR